jgi:hypothetical protein
MTQGIRKFTNDNFRATIPELATMTPAAFRAEVMGLSIVAFGISVASAATHYNHALKLAKAEIPELVTALGRAEDKKGGRKPIHTVDVIKVKTGEVVAKGISNAKAEAMIAAASAARKAKLAIATAADIVAEAVAGAAAEGVVVAEPAAIATVDTPAAEATTEAVAA